MKTFFIVILLMASSNLLFAQKKTEKAVIKTIIYCDHCKECGSCAGLMETELSYVKGIKSIEFSEKDTTITVKYNPKKINIEKIRIEIAKLGFAADTIPADASGYDKLDTCCKRRE